MKKASILFAVIVILITACNNTNTPPANKDSLKNPGDTVKIDTTKPTDSIIKG